MRRCHLGVGVDKQIKEDCKEWGRSKRHKDRAFPRRGVLGRFLDEGWGVSARSWGTDFVPNVDFSSARTRQIDEIWRGKMTERQANVFYLRFVAKGSPKEKAEALGISTASFYRDLDEALSLIPRY